MTSTTLSTNLTRPRIASGASRLAPWLRWAALRLTAWARRNAERDRADARRRDIAQVRRLAAQVRASQPGYANDLEAAAAAFEAQPSAR